MRQAYDRACRRDHRSPNGAARRYAEASTGLARLRQSAPVNRSSATRSRAMVSRLRRSLSAVLTALAIAAAEDGGAQAAGPVVVASKIDTEGSLLGNMIAAMLASNGI